MADAFRSLLVVLLAVCWAASSPARAQGSPGGVQAPSDFLASAYSSALLQLKAAEIAASKDVRPEVRQFAKEMVDFRNQQIQRLSTLATEVKVTLPAELTFEQKVLVDNLKPLDLLALARRYSELQLLALEQETRAYDESGRAAEQAISAYVGEYAPLLNQQRDKARELSKAVAAR